MPQLTLSGSLNYVAPGGGTVNQDIVAVGSYLASSLGTMDIPSGAASGATFTIPLGGVGNPIAFYLKSSIGTGALVKMQSNPTGLPIMDGGVMVYANPKTPGASAGPLSALAIQLTAAQTAYGFLDYEIFGD